MIFFAYCGVTMQLKPLLLVLLAYAIGVFLGAGTFK
jgi:hypothetical protein